MGKVRLIFLPLKRDGVVVGRAVGEELEFYVQFPETAPRVGWDAGPCQLQTSVEQGSLVHITGAVGPQL